jgi:hypothetical protein
LGATPTHLDIEDLSNGKTFGSEPKYVGPIPTSSTMQTVTLSRRNLLTLINKLNLNVEHGRDASFCTLLVQDDDGQAVFVHAVEDEVKYATRKPGYVLDAPTT